ncbi:hypothetical protein Btru_075575 [Bulinus truncatus]|nr:hypothetical protein Btru_075575 [Bulinus truncatus]
MVEVGAGEKSPSGRGSGYFLPNHDAQIYLNPIKTVQEQTMTYPMLKVQSDTSVIMTLKTDQSSQHNQLKARRAFKTLQESKRHRDYTPKINETFFLDAELQNVMKDKKENVTCQSKASKTLSLASSNCLHPHLLMASLLEQLCFMYAKEKSKANQLFKILCNRLIKLNIIAPLSHLDEMSSLRYQHRAMFEKIMRTAIHSLNQNKSLLALPPLGPSVDLENEDVISQQTSRYRIEFQELCLLGKGGFGSVYKAKNYLDGCEYAVKKIKFKHTNTDTLLKLLREVKALANLHHTNIVGYNAAWMEYDNPYFTAGKSLPSSPQKQDNTNESSASKNSTSFSIEFGFDTEEDDAELSAKYPEVCSKGFAMQAKLFSTVKVEESPKSRESERHRLEIAEKSTQILYTDSTHIQQSENKKHLHEETSSVNFNFSENNCKSQRHSEVTVKVKSHIHLEHTNCNQSKNCHPETNLGSRNCICDPKDILYHTKYFPKNNSDTDCVISYSKRVIQKTAITEEPTNIPAYEKTFDEDRHKFKPTNAPYQSVLQIPNIKFSTIIEENSTSVTSETCEIKAEDRKEISVNEDESSNIKDSVDRPEMKFKKQDMIPGRFYRSVKKRENSGVANESEEIIEQNNHSYHFQSSITLYIQMELCTITLHEWLLERNMKYQTIEDESLCLENMKIFHQVLLGVNFIHSQGLIHRDLKPRNIFLSGKDLHVKIGDFGLAKENVFSLDRENIFVKPSDCDDVTMFIDNHTTGVGTSSYASPEQLKGSFYDFKSDMYSLGVIQFEMFSVFTTEMERLKEIERLRKKGKCHKQFVQKWKLQADAIKALLSTNPVERPSAQDLLDSELFLSQEQQIDRLQAIIQQQKEEIDGYKKTLQEKDKIIKEKDAAIKYKDKLKAQMHNKLITAHLYLNNSARFKKKPVLGMKKKFCRAGDK